jgi:hypothetical protein
MVPLQSEMHTTTASEDKDYVLLASEDKDYHGVRGQGSEGETRASEEAGTQDDHGFFKFL